MSLIRMKLVNVMLNRYSSVLHSSLCGLHIGPTHTPKTIISLKPVKCRHSRTNSVIYKVNFRARLWYTLKATRKNISRTQAIRCALNITTVFTRCAANPSKQFRHGMQGLASVQITKKHRL